MFAYFTIHQRVYTLQAFMSLNEKKSQNFKKKHHRLTTIFDDQNINEGQIDPLHIIRFTTNGISNNFIHCCEGITLQEIIRPQCFNTFMLEIHFRIHLRGFMTLRAHQSKLSLGLQTPAAIPHYLGHIAPRRNKR